MRMDSCKAIAVGVRLTVSNFEMTFHFFLIVHIFSIVVSALNLARVLEKGLGH